MPILVQDIYHCVRALIKEELTLSGVELPPAPESNYSDEDSFRRDERKLTEKRKGTYKNLHAAARLADFPIIYNIGGESDD